MKRVSGIAMFFLTMFLFLNSNVAYSGHACEKLRAALSKYESCELEFHTDSTFSTQKSSGTAKENIVIRRQSDRALVSRKSVTSRVGTVPWRIQQDYIIQPNGDVIELQVSLDEKLEQESRLMCMLDSPRLADLGAINHGLSNALGALNSASVPAWLIDGAFLTEILDECSSVSESESGDGIQIELESRFGSLRVVTSEASGWLPETFELRKESKHFLARQFEWETGDFAPVSRVVTGTASEFRTDAAGRTYPTIFDVVRETQSRDQSKKIIKTKIKIEALTFTPVFTDDDFRSTIRVPDDMSVTVRGATHLPFKWSKGKVIPVTSPIPYSENDATTETPDGDHRMLLIVIGNTLLVAGIITIWHLRKKNRGA